MNKREVDEFLKPLKNRPDINPREEFKQELRNELFEKKTGMNKRPFVHWIPNLVAAALLVMGIYIGTDLIISDNTQDEVTPAQHLDPSQSVMIPDITEGEAREVVGTAFAHYSVIVNGGDPETGEVFQHDGMEYRFLGEDFSTEEEVMSYLQEKYTVRAAVMIYNEIPFIVLKEKLAQPNKYVSGNLLWADGEVLQLREEGEKTRLVTYKVPVEKSDQYQTFEVTLQYENGWKLDEQLPFTHGDNMEGTPQTKDGASEKEFTLTDEEQEIYEKFLLDFNEEHLRSLDPISIAKLYIYADAENNQEAVYELYTDKEGHVQWTKEEHIQMFETRERSAEEILDAYNGLPDGEFLEDEDGESGYIKFYNANGMMGFQMIKDEDGIWNVSYMPIQ
ncbi:RNA polymerase sigma factor SigX [Bacillus sp. SG-1]|uniref:RNA polymerase sigma factor SigX n=1 Tax=Bacillus sp. SG-1 TaxID=161544 RepID=UPI0001543CE0|nr:RNA polymerase sigma factor SigX [Bacillus sp. SG-1]EDL65915.1 RNA polymerase sigma factor SigX [Bacillus sp. SG-1]